MRPPISNLQAQEALPINRGRGRRFVISEWLGGNFAGKPHAKGGCYEEELISQEQTEPAPPNSLSAPVTMYDPRGMARLNAMPPNDKLKHGERTTNDP